jgi:hypothetical protein
MLVCRNVRGVPVTTMVALSEKLNGAAVSELQELAKVCRDEKPYDSRRREVLTRCCTLRGPHTARAPLRRRASAAARQLDCSYTQTGAASKNHSNHRCQWRHACYSAYSRIVSIPHESVESIPFKLIAG